MKNLFVAGVVVVAGFLLAGCKEEDEKTADSCEQTTGGGGGVAQCQAMPVCEDKYVQVETCSDGAECVDVELCGVKITCEVAVVVDDENPDEGAGGGGNEGTGGSGGDAPQPGVGGSGGSGG